MIFALILLAAATTAFDADMTADEKKTTGIYKLNEKEKSALQQWIDTNYQKKVAVKPTKPAATKSGLPTLSENLMNSKYLRLSDGTLWQVRPEDVPIAQGWITPAEIEVGQSTNPFFPSKLTNKISGSSVFVRKADKLPTQGKEPLSPTENRTIPPPQPPQK